MTDGLIVELSKWHVILRGKPLENYLEESDEREKVVQEFNDIRGPSRR